MKDENELSRLLRESKESCEIPADFNAQVWRKISLKSSRSPAAALGGTWTRLVEILLQPRYGYSLALVAILAGAALGQAQASTNARQVWSSLEGKYLASIDPYSQTGHGKHP